MAVTTQTLLANLKATYDSLVNVGDDQIIEITDTGTLTENLFLNSSTLTDHLTITVSAGNEYDFENPTAPHVKITSSSGDTYRALSSSHTLDTIGIEIESTNTGTGRALAEFGLIDIQPLCRFFRCRVRGGAENRQNTGRESHVEFYNCVISDAIGYGWFGTANETSTSKVVDTVLVNNGKRGLITFPIVTSERVVCFGNIVGDILDREGLTNDVASGDSTSYGAGALTGVVEGDFTDYANDVFTASSGGALDGTATGGLSYGLNLSAPTADTITILSPITDHMLQRSSPTEVTATINGSYIDAVTSPSSIEVSINGGAYSILDANPSGGVFSGDVSLPVGLNTVDVRFSNEITVTDSSTNVRVGDIFESAISQSNHADNNGIGVFTGATGYCAEYVEATGKWTNIIDTPNTSYFALMANQIVAEQNIPVGFIKVAVGGTSISQWQEGGSLMTDAVNAFNDSGGGGVANLMWIGENDAILGTDELSFKADTNAAIDYFHAQTGLRSMVMLPALTDTGSDNVRTWLAEIANSNTNADLGANMNLVFQAVHYTTQPETQAVADAAYSVIQPIYYPNQTSLLTITGTDFPDGTFSFDFYDRTSLPMSHIETKDMTFLNGNNVPLELNVSTSTPVIGLSDGPTPLTTGKCTYGVTT